MYLLSYAPSVTAGVPRVAVTLLFAPRIVSPTENVPVTFLTRSVLPEEVRLVSFTHVAVAPEVNPVTISGTTKFCALFVVSLSSEAFD